MTKRLSLRPYNGSLYVCSDEKDYQRTHQRVFGTPKDIARVIAASKIKFDQLIMEGGWVHISFAPTPRLQVLTARFTNGVARYTPGLT